MHASVSDRSIFRLATRLMLTPSQIIIDVHTRGQGGGVPHHDSMSLHRLMHISDPSPPLLSMIKHTHASTYGALEAKLQLSMHFNNNRSPGSCQILPILATYGLSFLPESDLITTESRTKMSCIKVTYRFNYCHANSIISYTSFLLLMPAKYLRDILEDCCCVK